MFITIFARTIRLFVYIFALLILHVLHKFFRFYLSLRLTTFCQAISVPFVGTAFCLVLLSSFLPALGWQFWKGVLFPLGSLRLKTVIPWAISTFVAYILPLFLQPPSKRLITSSIADWKFTQNFDPESAVKPSARWVKFDGSPIGMAQGMAENNLHISQEFLKAVLDGRALAVAYQGHWDLCCCLAWARNFVL